MTDYSDFNTELAKELKKLKKDLGALGVRQNYKGTGSQAHRRQIWVNLPNDGAIDIWADSGFVQIGGVVVNRPTGSTGASLGIPGVEREQHGFLNRNKIDYENKTPQEIYAEVLNVLRAWIGTDPDRRHSRRNPWLQKDVCHHNKRCASRAACRKQWPQIANSVLHASGDEGKAIRIANWQTQQMGLRRNPLQLSKLKQAKSQMKSVFFEQDPLKKKRQKQAQGFKLLHSETAKDKVRNRIKQARAMMKHTTVLSTADTPEVRERRARQARGFKAGITRRKNKRKASQRKVSRKVGKRRKYGYNTPLAARRKKRKKRSHRKRIRRKPGR